jgi:hypothetical protein
VGNDTRDIRWLGPLATPLGAALSLLGLFATFRSYANSLGWKLVSLVLLVVSSAWCAWYLCARILQQSTILGGQQTLAYRHQKRLWRRLSLLLPGGATILCGIAFLQPRAPDYTAMLQGGGPYSPVVVFDSHPAGAQVRLAWSLDAEGDPWLEGGRDKVFDLGTTPTRVRLSQGHYWAVFKLNGRRLQRDVLVTAPTVVTVEF